MLVRRCWRCSFAGVPGTWPTVQVGDRQRARSMAVPSPEAASPSPPRPPDSDGDGRPGSGKVGSCSVGCGHAPIRRPLGSTGGCADDRILCWTSSAGCRSRLPARRAVDRQRGYRFVASLSPGVAGAGSGCPGERPSSGSAAGPRGMPSLMGHDERGEPYTEHPAAAGHPSSCIFAEKPPHST